MINIFEVKETNNMVEHENLDVRTITIGISLLSCIDSDLKKLNENIYNRITSDAKDLAKAERELQFERWVYISIEYKDEAGECQNSIFEDMNL